MNCEWTDAEKRAIAENPDLPEDVAAAFAEELNGFADDTGLTFGDAFKPPIASDLPPAEPGSIQEMFPHLRDPRFV